MQGLFYGRVSRSFGRGNAQQLSEAEKLPPAGGVVLIDNIGTQSECEVALKCRQACWVATAREQAQRNEEILAAHAAGESVSSLAATLKKELIHQRIWPSKAELRTEVFEYIEVFFNRRRRHSTLGMLSPEQFENHHHQQTERITTTAAHAA